MSLVELIAQADERGLAAGGLACLDRCLPLLGGDDDLLRPLWTALADGSAWTEGLAKARVALDTPDTGTARLARGMLDAAPVERTADAVRSWSDACSRASLRVHLLLDPAGDPAGEDALDAARAGTATTDLPPLVAAELRRQTTVLELLADHGPQGLRPALDISVEGRRILRAVVSRRARGVGEAGV
ncbi:hypothetical protein NX794_26400 [Streptomyces sp. LP11]|uniref:Uncharacterized protein n=1 Tax=Streptomyces pyxinicus TaxID=2970331 RepID=A0ABT2B879_9ACTN|nr:hypothetical protein [Streptomyces sp. LP11]MCS0604721.1 hypothetical protein [Streptomyces sp. LP11]